MPSLEALYTLEAGSSSPTVGPGGGVVVLETGRIFGGDSAFCFTGRYDATGDTVNGMVEVVLHTKWPNPTV